VYVTTGSGCPLQHTSIAS